MKALFVIAPVNYQDKEYGNAKKELDHAGIQSEVVSTRKGLCYGRLGGKTEAKSLEEVKTNEFEAVIFIGGPGTPTVRADERFVKLAQEFSESGKLVCAICWAPTILAKAGILKGKKATLWIGFDEEYRKSTGEVLSSYGTEVVSEPVIKDGKIITADGPESATLFGKEIVKALKS